MAFHTSCSLLVTVHCCNHCATIVRVCMSVAHRASLTSMQRHDVSRTSHPMVSHNIMHAFSKRRSR
jgi:hypothetical protein